MIADTVDTGQQNKGCCRQSGQHREHLFTGHVQCHLYDHIPDHGSDAGRLQQVLRRGIIQAVFLYCIHIAFSAALILAHEIIFGAADLDLFHPLYRLGDPLEQAAVIVLIVLTSLVHDRLQHPFYQKQQSQQHQSQQNGHHSVGHKAIADDADRDRNVTHQLQQRQNQRIHIVDV